MKGLAVTTNVCIFIFILICILSVESNPCDLDHSKRSICAGHLTCSSCIETDLCCVWIIKPKYENSTQRCTSVAEALAENYNSRNLMGYENQKIYIVEDNEFSTTVESGENPAVQIKPQKVKLVLKPGETVEFEIKYKAITNYPLDIYYLMDLTHSMKDNIIEVIRLSGELSDTLKEMTQAYALALGYFSDKVVMPFYDQTMLDNPCRSVKGECYRGFNFVHALDFTQDEEMFKTEVNNSLHNMTANLDDLEGGLDALMQIIVCQEQLKWRKYSRKMVILNTDGLLHAAGDGLLAGIVKKNTGECQLTPKGNFLIYDGMHEDYPSFEQIYHKLRKHKTNVLIVTKQDQSRYYEALRNLMPDVVSVGTLKESFSNILDLVKKGYRAVVETVEFDTNHDENIVDVSISKLNENVALEKEYSFNVSVSMKTGEALKFNITEKHIEETIEVEVEPYGRCNCESDDNTICNNGKVVCGVCECNKNWYGSRCDREFQPHDKACSDNGIFDSIEGKCLCEWGFTGFLCEYQECKKIEGVMCSGHGECINGKCECYSGFKGENCECNTDPAVCTYDDKLCSLHGECECGTCKCHSNKYRGKFCEICDDCDKYCERHQEYVYEQCTNGTDSAVTKYADRSEFVLTNRTVECVFEYDENCRFYFTYDMDQTVTYQCTDLVCPPVVNVAYIGFGLFAIVFVTCLFALAIWKFTAMRKDYREYERFKKERNTCTTMTGENPLFINPVKTVNNPMYMNEDSTSNNDFEHLRHSQRPPSYDSATAGDRNIRTKYQNSTKSYSPYYTPLTSSERNYNSGKPEVNEHFRKQFTTVVSRKTYPMHNSTTTEFTADIQDSTYVNDFKNLTNGNVAHKQSSNKSTDTHSIFVTRKTHQVDSHISNQEQITSETHQLTDVPTKHVVTVYIRPTSNATPEEYVEILNSRGTATRTHNDEQNRIDKDMEE